MKITNLTPHTIVLRSEPKGHEFSFPSEGEARVATEMGDRSLEHVLHREDENGNKLTCLIPVHRPTVFGKIQGLPETANSADLLIVSAVVAAAAVREMIGIEHSMRTAASVDRERVLLSLVTPGTGPGEGAIRENGQVVAVTRLVRVFL